MIRGALGIYETFDKLEDERVVSHLLNTMDKKRFPYSRPVKGLLDMYENRFNLTLHTGPSLLLCVLKEFVKQLELPNTEENSAKVMSMSLDMNPIVANVRVKYHSDQNWAINPYDIVLVNGITFENLVTVFDECDNNPVLFKQDNQFFLYGCVNKVWKITSLKNEKTLMKSLRWPEKVEKVNHRQLPNDLFVAIDTLEAHKISRPKNSAFEAESITSRFRLFGYTKVNEEETYLKSAIKSINN